MAQHAIRLGVVGIGFGQHVHVPAFSQAGGHIAAICASNAGRAQAVAERLGIEAAFGDWREMLNRADLDAVSIAVPPSIQPQVAIGALEAGKAVFCEKPLASSMTGATAMAESARRAGIANVVNFEFPEIPAWCRAREVLRNAGALQHVSVSWNLETYVNRMKLDSWKNVVPEGGGALFCFGSHVFYNLEWLAGPVRTVMCLCPERADGTGTFAAIAAELECGAACSISISTDSRFRTEQRWRFQSKCGTTILSNETSDHLSGFRLHYGSIATGDFEELCAEPHSEEQDGRIAAVASLAARFLHWAGGGPPTGPDIQAGVTVQHLLQCALDSHRAGAKIYT